MTARYRPSGGYGGRRTHLNLNAGNYQPGERVLYEGFSGWLVGTIDRIAGDGGNTALIGVEAVQIQRVKGRVPTGIDEAALVAGLREAAAAHSAAVSAALAALEERRRALIAEHGVIVPYAQGGAP